MRSTVAFVVAPVILAIVLFSCSSTRTARTAGSIYADKFTSLTARIHDYKEQVKQYNEEYRVARQEEEIIERHPAFADLLRKWRIAESRAYVETQGDATARNRRAFEIFADMNLTADELAVLSAVEAYQQKTEPLLAKRAQLETLKKTLDRELDELKIEGERLRQQEVAAAQRMQALYNLLLLTQGDESGPVLPRRVPSIRCTTHRMGSSTYTSCY